MVSRTCRLIPGTHKTQDTFSRYVTAYCTLTLSRPTNGQGLSVASLATAAAVDYGEADGEYY